MKDKIQEFIKKIGIEVKNPDLLKQAFVHKSFLNEHHNFKLNDNERLEFLGDAVLELVSTSFLFDIFPEKPEGELTNIRASLVNSESLAEEANNLKIESCLFLSRGESKETNTKARKYILANCVEAIIGAIYLDSGYNNAKKFIEKYILYKLNKIMQQELYIDPKTKFQEKSQEAHNITPKYKLLEERGPDHNKIFTVGLFLDEKLVSKGKGSSKQEAEIEAAKAGLKKNNW
jgi:ribonuclease III